MLDARANSYAFFKKKGPLRVIAVIIMWSFLFTTLGGDILLEKAWAARTPLEPSGVGFEGVGSPRTIKKLDVDTFTLPQYLGQIKDSFNANSDKLIFHIQDAHCNYEAQHRIAEIIEFINSEYGIKVVNLEGGKGDYNLSIFTSPGRRLTAPRFAMNSA